MMSRNPLAIGLAVALACIGAGASAQTGDTLAKIKSSGVITIGARDSQVPFSYKTCN
ncbi:MAG: hypothetical protein Q8884_02610 [Sweet potato little leaf phytoplasma]|nr:hypothetical protein [Sweet potato little leaf phytoplasma]